MALRPPAPTFRRVLATLGAAIVLLSPLEALGQALPSPPLAPAAPSVPMPAAPSAPAAPAAPMVDSGPSRPVFELNVNEGSGNYATAIKVFLLVASLSVAPAVLMSVTSFTRIIIVLSLLRSAVGVQQLPPNKVLLGLALFLTLFTMAPLWTTINETALTPYESGQIDGKEAAQRALVPLRDFMLVHTREKDLELFIGLSGAARPETVESVSTLTIVPAFMLSELKTAFQMGAMLFLPFLIIDLVVASVLMSLGMMMLPPMIVSLPIKLFVFVLADGWGLVLLSLAKSVMQPLGAAH
jgi:flagellar biosynthetic protein FliP